MRIVTASQMKQIEKNADAAGLSYLQMMENAGKAAYQIILSKKEQARRFVIVAGKGNNGGDGFVFARLAARDGYDVRVILAEGQPVTQDAATNFDRLSGLPVSIQSIDEIDEIRDADVVVDALYGTGFHGELRSAGLKACEMMNRSGAYIAALDISSGLHADTGIIAKGAVRAHLTIPFDSYKPVHVTESALPFCGTIQLADIGIPDACHIG